MNKNLKEKLNIFIRCIIYMLVMSYTFCPEKDTIFVFIFFAKIFLDAILIDIIFLPFDNLQTNPLFPVQFYPPCVAWRQNLN